LLGVNNSGTISGYFGDGVLVPNNGYTLTPPSSYTAENVPAMAQTQVVAINNTGITGGFSADAAGDNFGFVNSGGVFTQVVNPSTPTSGITMNQILGLNDVNQAVGFYMDAAGNTHGYTYNVVTHAFTAVILPGAFGAVSVTAAGINNAGTIAGFYTDGANAFHGFLDVGGTFTSINDPNGTNTQLFGLNNTGLAVGSYVDGAGVNEGFVYNILTNTYETVDDPNNSATAAFNVTGTFINGVNDAGELVGFYSDGTNVDGFAATPVPEPGTLGLCGLVAIAAGLVQRRRRALAHLAK
jgi:hypothetical protein